jgi:hypothetical protein
MKKFPSYLYIPKITLNTDYPSQGSNSNGIADGWVYVDDYLIGVFELPATIPVTKKGYCKIEVRAGIRKNGQSNSRMYYPFYSTYVKYTTLIALK